MERRLLLIINKIKMQIEWHKREMLKRDKSFDFFEGRKVEAEVILSWLEKEAEINS